MLAWLVGCGHACCTMHVCYYFSRGGVVVASRAMMARRPVVIRRDTQLRREGEKEKERERERVTPQHPARARRYRPEQEAYSTDAPSHSLTRWHELPFYFYWIPMRRYESTCLRRTVCLWPGELSFARCLIARWTTTRIYGGFPLEIERSAAAKSVTYMCVYIIAWVTNCTVPADRFNHRRKITENIAA